RGPIRAGVGSVQGTGGGQRPRRLPQRRLNRPGRGQPANRALAAAPGLRRNHERHERARKTLFAPLQYGGCSARRCLPGGAMEFRLPCECGQRLYVEEGAAGGALLCPCGRTLKVPSLGELRRHFGLKAEDEPSDDGRFSPAQIVVLVIGAMLFAVVFLLGGLLSFAVGGVAGVGYLVSQVGQIWLLALVVRECPPQAIFYARVVPVVTCY